MNLLNHVAIIMDGNGRWGLKHKNSRNDGHRAGLSTIENILKETITQKIKFITLFSAGSVPISLGVNKNFFDSCMFLS